MVTQKMSRYRIPRSGMGPIVMTGRLVSSITTKGKPIETKKGFMENRWYDMALYQSATGKYVASVAFMSERKDESAYFWAESGSPAEVSEFLSDLDGLPPTYHVGYAPGSRNWHNYQNRLIQWLAQQYDSGVSMLLDGIPEFEEEV